MRRYLVIANQTLASDQLQQELLMRAEAANDECLFHFLVPNTEKDDYSPAWDTGGSAIQAGTSGARRRLREAMSTVRAAGASALGALGDPNPIKAVELQMQCSVYDEIIVSVLPQTLSRWLMMDLPSRIGRAVKTPVTTITAKAG